MHQPSLDPDLLHAFVAVADHLSFTRAAVALNRTQSAVSTQIKRLEDRLGTALFVRTTAHVRLTPEGEGLLGYARRMLTLNAEAVERLRQRELGGAVRIGVMDDYGMLMLPRPLARFAAAYPRIAVEMETGLTSRLLESLGTRFDLVIAMHPEGAGDGRFLVRERAVWATSAHHTVEGTDPLPVALYPPGCLFRQWACEALDESHRPWRLAFTSHSLGAVEAIVREGLAVTVVKSGTFPASLRRLTAQDGFPDLPSADIRLHRAPTLSPAAQRLAEHLSEALVR